MSAPGRNEVSKKEKQQAKHDAFMKSDLKQELCPTPVDKRGKPLLGPDRRRAARVFGELSPEKVAEFQEEANRINLERAAEDVVDASDCDEATRAQ